MTHVGSGPSFKVRHGAASDPGQVRSHNQDSYLTAEPVFIVADGMGGHVRGAAASAAVVAAFEPLAGRDWVATSALHDAVQRATADVVALADISGAPGSTLAGVGLTEQGGRPYWLVFNIGDSRVYLLRQADLEQISVDHSRVQELLEAGVAPGDINVGRNVITRALGGGSGTVPSLDQWLVPATTGDRVVICSDGLTSEVTDHLLLATLVNHPDPMDAARALVRTAVEAGGRDNVTVVVVDATEVAHQEGDVSDVDDTLTGASGDCGEDTIEVGDLWTKEQT